MAVILIPTLINIEMKAIEQLRTQLLVMKILQGPHVRFWKDFVFAQPRQSELKILSFNMINGKVFTSTNTLMDHNQWYIRIPSLFISQIESSSEAMWWFRIDILMQIAVHKGYFNVEYGQQSLFY